MVILRDNASATIVALAALALAAADYLGNDDGAFAAETAKACIESGAARCGFRTAEREFYVERSAMLAYKRIEESEDAQGYGIGRYGSGHYGTSVPHNGGALPVTGDVEEREGEIVSAFNGRFRLFRSNGNQFRLTGPEGILQAIPEQQPIVVSAKTDTDGNLSINSWRYAMPQIEISELVRIYQDESEQIVWLDCSYGQFEIQNPELVRDLDQRGTYFVTANLNRETNLAEIVGAERTEFPDRIVSNIPAGDTIQPVPDQSDVFAYDPTRDGLSFELTSESSRAEGFVSREAVEKLPNDAPDLIKRGLANLPRIEAVAYRTWASAGFSAAQVNLDATDFASYPGIDIPWSSPARVIRFFKPAFSSRFSTNYHSLDSAVAAAMSGSLGPLDELEIRLIESERRSWLGTDIAGLAADSSRPSAGSTLKFDEAQPPPQYQVIRLDANDVEQVLDSTNVFEDAVRKAMAGVYGTLPGLRITSSDGRFLEGDDIAAYGQTIGIQW